LKILTLCSHTSILHIQTDFLLKTDLTQAIERETFRPLTEQLQAATRRNHKRLFVLDDI